MVSNCQLKNQTEFYAFCFRHFQTKTKALSNYKIFPAPNVFSFVQLNFNLLFLLYHVWSQSVQLCAVCLCGIGFWCLLPLISAIVLSTGHLIASRLRLLLVLLVVVIGTASHHASGRSSRAIPSSRKGNTHRDSRRGPVQSSCRLLFLGQGRRRGTRLFRVARIDCG